MSALREILDLPGPLGERRSLVQQLRMGRSVIWRVPSTADVETLLNAVLEECMRAYLSVTVVPVGDGDSLPAAFLAEYLGLSADKGYRLGPVDIIRCKETPEILVLTGLDGLHGSSRQLWQLFVEEWADAARLAPQESGQVRALLVPVRSCDFHQADTGDVFLVVKWFWGWFSPAELRLAARSMCMERGMSRNKSAWLEWVGVEVAGTDPELLGFLMEQCDRATDGKGLNEVLIEFAGRRSWDPRTLREFWDGHLIHGAPGWLSRPEAPPGGLGRLWEEGILDWHPEEGLFIHSAVLALLDYNQAVEHRVWIGQARLLLPLIDLLRLRICARLNVEVPGWRSYCTSRQCSNGSISSIETTPRVPVADFPDIIAFIDGASRPMLRNSRHKLEMLRRARNSLAHYKPLDWKGFCDILQLDQESRHPVGAATETVPTWG